MSDRTIFVSIAPSRGGRAQICWQTTMDEQARARFGDVLSARGQTFPVGGALIYGRADQLLGALPHGRSHAECYETGRALTDWVIWHVGAGGALDIPSTDKGVWVEPAGARVCDALDRSSLTDKELDTLRLLRQRGFAVVVFNPTELREADPDGVQDRLVELGWDVIEAHATDRITLGDAERAIVPDLAEDRTQDEEGSAACRPS
jgi:hypothetical protein